MRLRARSPKLLAAAGFAAAVVVAAIGLVAAPHGSAVPHAAVAGATFDPTPSPTARPGFDRLLIADRGTGRLLVVDRAGTILWQFPAVPGRLPNGHAFSADDAFFAPDGKTIVANDEDEDMVYRIDIASRTIVWSYGDYGHKGSLPGQLNTPDDAYPLANGDITVADIFNCRILEIAPDHSIVHQFGSPARCTDRPPASFDIPNGDTPLPDGGLLVTEIAGSRVVRLDAAGRVLFDIHVPVTYPSDAQLTPDGNVLVVDYSRPGAVLLVNSAGHVVWRYSMPGGPGLLDHPSLAVPLPDGTVLLNDDFHDRVVQIDPKTNRIIWQYGVTGHDSTDPGYLSGPDGLDPVPPGIKF